MYNFSIAISFEEYRFINEKKLTNPKFQKWREWLAAIEPEIRLLLRDARGFWEIQIIIDGHRRTQDFHYGYLERSYLDHVITILRRQIKPYKGHTSFVGLLHEIAENLQKLPHTSSDSDRLDPNDMSDSASPTDTIGTHICPEMVTEDIVQLTSALEACEAFADERLAYCEKQASKNIPLSKELDACFKLLDKTYVKYHVLFYGDGLKTLQPPRQAGTLKGLIRLADDFDAELPEFEEYMR